MSYKILSSRILLFLLGLVVFASCRGSSTHDLVQVSVELRNQFQDEAYIEIKPIHYKYAPKNRWHFGKGERVQQSYEIEVPKGSWLVLRLGADEYDMPVMRTGSLRIEADGASRPVVTSIQVDGEVLQDYLRWMTDDLAYQDSIRSALPDFNAGSIDNTIRLAKARKKFARSVFENGDLNHITHRILGEYLVLRLQAIPRKATLPGYDPAQEREAIFKDARRNNFFTLEVLRAQRAGSRDFTHAWSNSFGFDAEIRREFGAQLSAQDVQRLGYDLYNAARQSVADKILDQEAKAYTEMHLLAERLGDAPFEQAEPSYQKWMQDWSALYPSWADFLTTHYEGVKRVTPGQPGIPFVYTDNLGQQRSLDDFKGKYVLLDFWANWCAPCLEEFPDMRRIYAQTSRDDFEIVAISLDLDRDYWLSRIPAHNNPWPQLWAGKQFEEEVFLSYRAGGIPFYVLLGRDGTILRVNDIRATYNLESVLKSLLDAEKAS
jgi:thiol-disulfide isomerase/thioredoxin